MQVRERNITTNNSTLNHLIMELGEECQNVISLINQLQLSDLSNKQKVEILAELLASTIHLHSHCDQDFQDLIANELEFLP
jgi:hypothetical protein